MLTWDGSILDAHFGDCWRLLAAYNFTFGLKKGRFGLPAKAQTRRHMRGIADCKNATVADGSFGSWGTDDMVKPGDLPYQRRQS